MCPLLSYIVIRDILFSQLSVLSIIWNRLSNFCDFGKPFTNGCLGYYLTNIVTTVSTVLRFPFLNLWYQLPFCNKNVERITRLENIQSQSFVTIRVPIFKLVENSIGLLHCLQVSIYSL